MEIFYRLIDSTAADAAVQLERGAVEAEFSLGSSYTVFKNRIVQSLQQNGLELKNGSFSRQPGISYVIEDASVKYSEPFRQRFFGSFYTEREVNLKGNFLIYKDMKVHEFNYSVTDTVEAEKIQELENSSFPFARGELPAEPFFSGLLEPAAALTTAAVAIYLFFTVRSK